VSDTCEHGETVSDGDTLWCSEYCGRVLAIWIEPDGWVEATPNHPNGSLAETDDSVHSQIGD
jgi:hypothetical protein